MKLLILTQYFAPEPGAAQTRLAGMTRELMRMGHQVEIVTALPNYPIGRIYSGYQGRFYQREIWEGVVVHRLWSYASLGSGFRRVVNYVSFACTSIMGILRAKKPDYVFIESPPPLLAINGIVAARLWDVPVVVNVADLWPDTARDFGFMRGDSLIFRTAKAVEHCVYAHADFVCAVTEGIREALVKEKGVLASKVLFLPNGVDTVSYYESEPDKELARSLGVEGKQVLLYPGTLGFPHDADKLVRAAQFLQDTSIHMIFVGGGSSKESLCSLAKELHLANVTFLNPVAPERINSLLSISIGGLVSVRNAPIMHGARPAKMFVIMSCAKPVIYAGIGEGAALLAEARAGIQISDEDPQSIATAIRAFVADPQRARELGRNGRDYVVQNFNWGALVENWIAQLERSSGAKSCETLAVTTDCGDVAKTGDRAAHPAPWTAAEPKPNGALVREANE